MDHNDLDKILKESGWFYDNGWQHDSETWDCYVNNKHGSESFVVILAKKGKGRLLHLQGKPVEKREVWQGLLSCEEDVKELLEYIRNFEAKHA